MKKRKKKINPIKLMICLMGVFMFSFSICLISGSELFNLKKIDISGNKSITNSSIVNSIGVKKGVNIFSVNKKDIEKKILENSYVDSVTVDRRLPNTLLINIVEKEVYATLKNDKNYCYIDSKGNLIEELEGTNEHRDDKIIEVDYRIDDDNKIEFKDSDIKNKFFAFISAIEKYDIYEDTKSVDMLSSSKIDMLAKNNTKISLTNDENIDYNVLRISKVLTDLNSKNHTGGTLDLTKNKYAVYNPE